MTDRDFTPESPRKVISAFTAAVQGAARAIDGDDWNALAQQNVAAAELKLQVVTGLLLAGAPRLAEGLDIAAEALDLYRREGENLKAGHRDPAFRTTPTRAGEALARIAQVLQPDAGGAAAEVSGSVRRCRACGCTDTDCSGCIARTGQACCWAEEDLCSACVPSAAEGDEGNPGPEIPEREAIARELYPHLPNRYPVEWDQLPKSYARRLLTAVEKALLPKLVGLRHQVANLVQDKSDLCRRLLVAEHAAAKAQRERDESRAAFMAVYELVSRFAGDPAAKRLAGASLTGPLAGAEVTAE